MAITPSIVPEDDGLPLSRNSIHLRTGSPSPSSALKQVRRQNSFLRRADSSEEFPSPHESIFEAFYFSATNSDESNNRIELITLSPYNVSNDENRGLLTPTRNLDDIYFRYGRGTALETIAEQKSTGTRTISRTKSLDDLHNAPFLNHRDSFILSKGPRRKQSFSFDDLALINQYYHDACATIENGICKSHRPEPLITPEIYAQPKKPLHEPPNRPPTPPGMPSWTAAQLIPFGERLAQPPSRPNRIRRLFGISASGSTVSPQHYPESIMRDTVVSIPNRGRTAPRFRPPRSAYGPLDQHPFTRAPLAQAITKPQFTTLAQVEVSFLTQPIPEPNMAEIRRKKSRSRRSIGQRVRFTPSATARDSEALALQSAIETTSANALHPLSPIQVVPQNTMVPQPCHHRIKQLSKQKCGSDENSSNPRPIGIEYDTLPSDPTSYLDQADGMEQRQLSTPSSYTAVNCVSLSPGLSWTFRDIEATTSSGLNSRFPSVTSTAPLMSGALQQLFGSSEDLKRRSPVSKGINSKIHSHWCWKCKFEAGWEVVNRWWMNGASFVCFVCCGFDVDEDRAYSDTRVVFNPYSCGIRGDD
jgi:hypothetical protein